jgi:hypothetical protein
MSKITAVIGLLLAATSCAHAENVNAKWKEVGGWSIAVDREDYGCFMITEWERGTIIRLGFDADRNSYMWVSHDSWRSLEEGKKYSLTMKFDDETPWSGPAFAHRTKQGAPLLTMKWDRGKANFLREFAVSQGVTIWYGEKVIARLRLTGSYAAMAELQNCQKTMDASRDPATPPAGRRVSDPFEGSQRVADPFRQ